MIEFIILFFIFAAAVIIFRETINVLTDKFSRLQSKKVERAHRQLEDIFVNVDRAKLFFYYTLSPVLCGVLSFLVFNNLVIGFLGAGLGLGLPTLIINRLKEMRRQKFQKQLVDALQVLSSSLRSGLSFSQALEVLVEDTPPPLSDEFSLVLRENRMGVSLEEGLSRLAKRMPLEELDLMINSILVSQETGGNLTRVFDRLATTIRDSQKLKENIKTLTLQGRMQGIIMSVLPLVFIWWTTTVNKHHFDIMLSSDIGRMLLLVAVVLQIVGMVLIHRFSKLGL